MSKFYSKTVLKADLTSNSEENILGAKGKGAFMNNLRDSWFYPLKESSESYLSNGFISIYNQTNNLKYFFGPNYFRFFECYLCPFLNIYVTIKIKYKIK